jgi:hypothetical protein
MKLARIGSPGQQRPASLGKDATAADVMRPELDRLPSLRQRLVPA